MSEPSSTVSIVIPTVNRPDLLRSAVRSALEALTPNGEVVVTDDGDLDRTRVVLADFDQSCLKLTKNTGAKGAGANRNNGVAAARGDLVFFLDDDDLMFRDYVHSVMEVIRGQEVAAWGFSSTREHDRGTSIGELTDKRQPISPLSDRPTRKSLAGLGCGFWIRREVFQSVGGIREDLEANEDTDFCLSLIGAGFLPWYSDRPGVSLYRGEPSSLTRKTAPKVRATCFRKIFENHSEMLDMYPDIRRFVLSRYLKHAGRAGDFKLGLNAIQQSGSVAETAKNSVLFATNMVLGSFNK